MLKHPEGGWYKETYRARGVISAEELPKHGGARNYSTGIYFLLTEENFSAFHRIKSAQSGLLCGAALPGTFFSRKNKSLVFVQAETVFLAFY